MVFNNARIRQADNAAAFKPQLTSLVDVMTILLVFLIKSFSVDGNIVTPADNLNLPASTSQQAPTPVTTIAIASNAILADGVALAKVESFATADSLTIPALLEWMHVQKGKSEAGESGRTIMIQTDRDVPFNIMKRVMFTCSKAGYDDFSILVIHEGA